MMVDDLGFYLKNKWKTRCGISITFISINIISVIIFSIIIAP